jgi:multidrug efflux system membrane fusion protein
MRKTRAVMAALLVAGVVGWAVYWRTSGTEAAAETKSSPTAPAAVQITAGVAESRDMPIYVSGLGTVQGYNTVTVQSRVDGQIKKVDFKEGQEVKTGDLLFEIDARPFQAALAQATATKQKDEAQLVSALADLKRDQELVAHSFQTKQAYDQQKALVGEVQGSIGADQAQIAAAQLNVEYANIRSPIDGRTGARLVDVGNLVHSTANTALVTITQLKPIFVSFTVPQSEFETIRASQDKSAIEAEAIAQSTQKPLATGQVTLIDNQIDQATGTLHLKAVFANDNEALWPGQFVEARLVVGTLKNAVVVPTRAVQEGPNGDYLFVIKPDMTVAIQTVHVAQTEQGLDVIDKGLTAGTRIVVDGQYRLEQGTKVAIQTAAAAKG